MISKKHFSHFIYQQQRAISYNVSFQALSPVNKEFVFVELMSPVYIMRDWKVIATLTVNYLYQETKVTHNSQFELGLQNQDNWKIIK